MVVTIVIPLHNSEKDLPSLINFLDQQTFRDFSLLFVDDYSSDQTVFALERILSGSPLPFRILKKEQNGGAGKARDYAIDSGLITTKYVIFLDPDDEPLPSFLELLVAKADATNADITMCGFERKSKVDGHIIATEMVNNPETITELESCPIIPFLNPAPWNKLIKMKIIHDARFINRGCGEDEMFFLKILPYCRVLSFVNKVLYRYYVHADSVISQMDYKIFLETRNGYANVHRFYDAHGGSFDKFYSLLEASVFVRFGIGATTRFCLGYPKKTKQILAENKSFFKENFPGWFRNPYLSFWHSVKGGPKTLMIWRCKWLYKIGFFQLFLFDYKLFTNLFKKDIKW